MKEGMMSGNQSHDLESSMPREAIEEVMSKVIDIDTPGTAFTRVIYSSDAPERDTHWINSPEWKVFQKRLEEAWKRKEITASEYEDKTAEFSVVHKLSEGQKRYLEWQMQKEKLRTIFRYGILGGSVNTRRDKKSSVVDTYADLIRKKDKTIVVYANIVGRSDHEAERYIKGAKTADSIIGDSYYSSARYEEDFPISFIFDTNNFDEMPPGHDRKEPRKMFSFRTDPANTLGLRDEAGRVRPIEEYGFTFAHRIPPRALRGLVVNMKTDGQRAKLKEIIDIMVSETKGNPRALLPIYDLDGNLVWPKAVSHDALREKTG